jgi:hypothetical protein
MRGFSLTISTSRPIRWFQSPWGNSRAFLAFYITQKTGFLRLCKERVDGIALAVLNAFEAHENNSKTHDNET